MGVVSLQGIRHLLTPIMDESVTHATGLYHLGGLNSVAGSVVGAIGFNLMSEALRPLEILKWIIIPVLLILVMVFRPTGLIAFRELDIERALQPKKKDIKRGTA